MNLRIFVAVVLILIGLQASRAESAEGVDYLQDIKPLLRDKCFACHGALKQEGGLRLDAASLIAKGGESGPSIVAGAVGKSLILERVKASDDNRMPPADDGPRLTAEEVEKLTMWIKTGAKAPEEAIPEHPSRHWAFLRPVKADVPDVAARWVRNDIDRFLAAEQERIGVTAVGETSRAMLLRRASLTLTGLPPTPRELSRFLEDGSEAAFEKAVDRLLKSPHYGERWARHFMDIWRYSDPSGYGKEIRDGREHIWRWRDWIVESLNDDKSYDRMVVEMLAADEVAPGDQDALRATGFLARNWYKFNRNVWLDNTVEHSSKAFLGLTMNCARCHAHKYDPFDQIAYYRMRAIFETHDVRDDRLENVSKTGSGQGMLVRAYDAHPDRKTFRFLQGDENRPDKDNALPPGLPKLLGQLKVKPVQIPVTAWYPALRKENRESSLEAARSAIVAAETEVKNTRVALSAAKKKLDEFKPPTRDAEPSKKSNPKSEVGTPVLSDDFSKLDQTKWMVESGEWSAKDGRIIQSDGATKQHRLLSLINHPRDFLAKLRLRITGGETYKSVGFGFDGHGSAMNAVYLSVSGPKVQYTFQGSDARWHYPAKGMAAHPIKTGQDYLLEIAVRDRLLNVLIDGELKVAYQLPNRKAGKLSVWAFSATSEFDRLDVTTLPTATQLAAAAGSGTNPKVVTRKDLQLALRVAESTEQVAVAKLAAAKAALASLEARTAAELAKHRLSTGDANALGLAAARAGREHSVKQFAQQMAQAKLKIAQARQKKQSVAAAEKEFASVTKKLEDAAKQLNNGSSKYSAVGTQYPKTSSGRRLAFAKWITDRKNPLAARVLVNHVWLRHFDATLLERTFDFGLRSKRPRHAQLLDWLAVQFMEDGWSLKKLHKRILMSGIYRRSSSAAEVSAETRKADPDNLTLWRMNARRMEAEVVRDSVLFLGNSLDLTMGGPPVEHTQGQNVLRRSLYFRQDKERQMTFLNLFDGAKVNECYERKATVAPQQALAMFNSKIANGQARKLALAYETKNAASFVESLFQHVLCRDPSSQEQAECTKFLAEFKASAEARRQLALVLLNHNDFVTIR